MLSKAINFFFLQKWTNMVNWFLARMTRPFIGEKIVFPANGSGKSQGDYIQPWHTLFSYLEPVCCSMSSSSCYFLICIQTSQEAGQVVWYSHLFQNFPQFIVIHTVKGFGIVNKAEIDVFLEQTEKMNMIWLHLHKLPKQANSQIAHACSVTQVSGSGPHGL